MHFYGKLTVILRAIGINGDERQKRTLSFLRKCKSSGQELKITGFSISEFKSTVQYYVSQLELVPFNKINPEIFAQNNISPSFYEFFHRWRKGRAAGYGFDLFLAHITGLYHSFVKEFAVTEDYKAPFNENDKDILKIINKYVDEIKTWSGKYEQSARYDALNILFVERRRGENSRNITDTKFFFVSVDQKLRNWDFQRSDRQPIALLPSQWMSVILKYFSRTDDDYKSFVSFLHLKLQDPVIQDQQAHLILSGISEVTEDFGLQREIFDAYSERQIQRTLEGKDAFEVWEEAQLFAKTIADEKIVDLKLEYDLDKEILKTVHTSTTLEFKKSLLDEKRGALQVLTASGIQVDNNVARMVRRRKILFIGAPVTYYGLLIFLICYFGWQKMEALYTIATLLFPAVTLGFALFKKKNLNPATYLDEYEADCRRAEEFRFNYESERVEYLYEGIRRLEKDLSPVEKGEG